MAQPRGLAREGGASARRTDKGGQREKTGGAPCYGRLGKFSILPGDLKIQGGNVSAASREAGEEGQERLRRRCTFGDRVSIFECLTGGGEGRFGKMGWEWEISGDECCWLAASWTAEFRPSFTIVDRMGLQLNVGQVY